MTETLVAPTPTRTEVARARGREALRELLFPLLCVAGVPALARRQWRGQLAILAFHGVEAAPLSPACSYVHDAATLRSQLLYVRRHFRVLPLEEALERLSAGTLPDNAATLTFDDGTRNLATVATPILDDLGLPASFFVATSPMGTNETLWPDRLWLAFTRTKKTVVDLSDIGIGSRSLDSIAARGEVCDETVARLKTIPDSERMTQVDSIVAKLGTTDDGDAGPFKMLSWDEARELANCGFVTLYPHSATHPMLSRCSDEKVEQEVAESCLALERETGHAPTVFAYPNGDFDFRTKSALRRNGIRWALSSITGFAHRGSDPLALPRLGIGNSLTPSNFQLQVSGALPLRSFRPGPLKQGATSHCVKSA